MYFVIALIVFTLNFFAVGVSIGFILLYIGAYPFRFEGIVPQTVHTKFAKIGLNRTPMSE